MLIKKYNIKSYLIDSLGYGEDELIDYSFEKLMDLVEDKEDLKEYLK